MKSSFTFLLVISLFIFSCNRTDHASSALANDVTAGNEGIATSKILADSSGTSGEMILQSAPPVVSNDWDKKIIKTASVRLEVKDYKVYNLFVHRAAKNFGGYISGEEQNNNEGMLESNISIKVPVDQFELLMNQLGENAAKIVQKKVTTDDVTGEIVDTKSRLQTKEQMKLKYLQFLSQAKNVTEVLKVQGEINTIQEEIESAATRINFLSHQAAMSTIDLSFYQPVVGYTGPDNDPGFFTRMITAFKNGFNFVSELFIGLISIWPLLILLFLTWVTYKKRKSFVTTSKV
ncbi:hypothetical protein BH09BAC2_BH09BAC2_20410 [soil metagenome]